jgi:polyphenol oxidase
MRIHPSPERHALPRFLQSQLLLGFPHAFSTKIAGDFALQRPARAIAEVGLLASLCVAPGRLHQVSQVHGAQIAEVSHAFAPAEATQADALYAVKGSGRAIGVRAADCVPILLACVKSRAVMAVHAGWRGVENRIVVAAIARLAGSCAEGASSVRAAIGPCIGACCFEVGADVAARIAAASALDVARAQAHGSNQRWVDLRRAVRTQLRASGVADAHIEDVGGCTRCEPEHYWSYRREGDASGRLIAAIASVSE